MHITGRSKKDLENSLASLQSIDIKKIKDLSSNYKRLQKYTKLANTAGFKKEVEKDLGRKLTDNQLQHAVNSIRKANTYIANVLDGKFVPHGTHGINHVKHNLEYGYQLMGLMEPRKRRAA
jgi:capsular polysaccharide biosynthesis protein